MSGDPLACSCGRTFKPGDPHYDMAKSSRAQGLPDHPTDPAQLARIAQVLVDAVRRQADKTPAPGQGEARGDDSAGSESTSPPHSEESSFRASS